MLDQHNFMAHKVSAHLLHELRTGRAGAWATERLSTNCTLWQGMADWPRPDFAFEDRTNNASLAIEFKPPNQLKREYVTGLGQAITYLNDFEFSGLVVPGRTGEGFQIASYLLETLKQELKELPLALFAYDQNPTDLTVLRPLRARIEESPVVPKGIGRNVFWGYWRDLSNYDLFELLRIVDQRDEHDFEKCFQRFWNRFAVTGRARTWEGKPRKQKAKEAQSMTSERLNTRLSMWHSGLLSVDGRLTVAGHNLLRTGKIYSPDSIAFLDKLAYHVLIDGNHLELILWINEQNRRIGIHNIDDRNRYFSALDETLVDVGVIATRKPKPAKAHFIRDEPKLWNKLGLLERHGNGRYFHEKHGLVFSWRKILSIIDNT